jgi:hypothetical protein
MSYHVLRFSSAVIFVILLSFCGFFIALLVKWEGNGGVVYGYLILSVLGYFFFFFLFLNE